MTVEAEVKIKILDGEKKGEIHTFTTIGHTKTSYDECGIIERLNLVWNYIRPYESIKTKEKSNEEILEYFKDINHAYNDCTKYDTLKRMLDELQSPILDEIRDEIAHLHDWAFSREEILRIIDKYREPEEEKSCSNCKFWCLDANDKNRRCKYCYNQDEWQAESEVEE